MNLTKLSPSKNNTKQQKKSPQHAFQKEWERVQNLQQQRDKLQTTLEESFAFFRSSIQNSETMKTEIKGILCRKLISFVIKKPCRST